MNTHVDGPEMRVSRMLGSCWGQANSVPIHRPAAQCFLRFSALHSSANGGLSPGAGRMGNLRWCLFLFFFLVCFFVVFFVVVEVVF